MHLPVYATLASTRSNTVAGDAVAAGVMPSDTCVSVNVNGQGQVCLSVPVVGNVCIPVNTPLPSGTAASACINVCTKWGVPSGACVTVSALGQQIASQCFGWC
ncbi:hypothetical protein [Azospirillum thermophilum]|uniref:Uncharacterized protein n=1 Tax=Azospirillum thermophilum TaxID=2202148 RepID=A0A2S2CMN8_9PROT|nr:hypothetical protein [Azospirillum thermophilum]AWK85774.1 hypothetical protein DEW08_05980 [Azospirillum thermophilum]